MSSSVQPCLYSNVHPCLSNPAAVSEQRFHAAKDRGLQGFLFIQTEVALPSNHLIMRTFCGFFALCNPSLTKWLSPLPLLVPLLFECRVFVRRACHIICSSQPAGICSVSLQPSSTCRGRWHKIDRPDQYWPLYILAEIRTKRLINPYIQIWKANGGILYCGLWGYDVG